ncbi:DedA family protein [Parvibaculum sp.]|uniref:DedA family protein n=1 Tax=Parvibaculum sp. TaxID=2024848 RepID=UPI002CE72B8D|nr:DedA family protein [Parvibaculum sp.]HUD50764.1 DedA family protein [Parvibaculum sp.]
MEQYVHEIVGFIRQHSEWTGPIIFLVAFGESFAFLSLVVPGTAIMIAAGTLVPEGVVPIVPLLAGGILGATLGDGISYWIGLRFGHLIPGMWPFRSRPELLASGHRFFERHGAESVFIGRFFGPVRAVIPLIAGMMEMPPKRFWLANVLSALIWGPALLVPGIVANSVWQFFEREEGWVPYAVLAAFLGLAGLAWIVWTYRRKA